MTVVSAAYVTDDARYDAAFDHHDQFWYSPAVDFANDLIGYLPSYWSYGGDDVLVRDDVCDDDKQVFDDFPTCTAFAPCDANDPCCRLNSLNQYYCQDVCTAAGSSYCPAMYCKCLDAPKPPPNPCHYRCTTECTVDDFTTRLDDSHTSAGPDPEYRRSCLDTTLGKSRSHLCAVDGAAISARLSILAGSPRECGDSEETSFASPPPSPPPTPLPSSPPTGTLCSNDCGVASDQNYHALEANHAYHFDSDGYCDDGGVDSS